jgi:hypothetical protein
MLRAKIQELDERGKAIHASRRAVTSALGAVCSMTVADLLRHRLSFELMPDPDEWIRSVNQLLVGTGCVVERTNSGSGVVVKNMHVPWVDYETLMRAMDEKNRRETRRGSRLSRNGGKGTKALRAKKKSDGRNGRVLQHSRGRSVNG